MTEEPRSLTIQRKAIPDHVEDAVLHGLEKLPADRFATAAEFAGALGGTSAGRSATTRHTTARAAASKPRWRDPVVLALAAVALCSLAWAGWSRSRTASSETPVVSFATPISDVGSSVLGFSSLSISRDGRLLAYLGSSDSTRRQLVVRALDDPEERTLPGTADASHPVFSPDGRWIAYVRGNQLFKIRIEGGVPEPLGTAPGTFAGMSWSTAGRIILSGAVAMYTIPEGGGTPVPLMTPGAAAGRDSTVSSPVAWDEAGVLLYSTWSGGSIQSARIAIASLDGTRATTLELPGTQPVGVIDGVLVYVTSTGTLMGVPIDLRRRELTGAPVQLVTDIRTNLTTGIARAVMSRTGTLMYERGSQLSRVVVAAPGGVKRVLLAEPREYAFPRLSPDGTALAVTIRLDGRRDIWVYDLRSGSPTRLTTDGATNERPEWTPDGSRVLYRSDRENQSSIWWRHVDLRGDAEPLLNAPGLLVFEAVMAPDGSAYAYQLDTLGADVWYRRLAGDTTPQPVATNPNAIETMPRISPDGRWIAFVTDEAGAEAVVVQPFPGPGGRTQVSTGSGVQPVWSRDGDRLVYRSGGWFVSARVRRTPDFAVVSRDTLFRDEYIFATNPHANFDIAPDGGVVALQPTSTGERVVVSNWRAVLRAAMAQAAQ